MTYPKALQVMICAGAALAAPAAMANTPVTLDSAVFVERMHGDNQRSLEPATRLSRGDRVITIVSWQRTGGTTATGSFTLVNPLPRSLAYQASASDDAEVSVDGGNNWGRIGNLRIAGHMATPEDVTHVRWRVPADHASAGSGQIAYSGIVR